MKFLDRFWGPCFFRRGLPSGGVYHAMIRACFLHTLIAGMAACAAFRAGADTIYWGDNSAGSGVIHALDVSTGKVSTVIVGNAGDPASNNINNPVSMTVGPDGNLYVGSSQTGNIVRVTPGGAAALYYPAAWPAYGLAFDRGGNLYAAQYVAGTIGKIAPNGAFTTFASGLDHPAGGKFDPSGNLYVATSITSSDETITKITPSGTVSTFITGSTGVVWDTAGNLYQGTGGSITLTTPAGNTSVLASGLVTPQPIGVGTAGDLYVLSGPDIELIKISPSGNVTMLADLPGEISVALSVPEPALCSAATFISLLLARRSRRGASSSQ